MTPDKTLVIVGNPVWLSQVTAPDGFRLLHQPDTTGYMDALIFNYAALVVVDGHVPDWTRWTHAPKSSPATRRIPIVLVADDGDIRANAPKQGVDFAFSQAEFLAQFATIVSTYARVVRPETAEQLDCECQEALPERAIEGIERFNNGEYYRQHDLFEAQWVATETPVRDLYRAILQVGVAYYQIERGNYKGAVKMLQRSVQWLLILPDVCQTVDVADLRARAFAVLRELQRLGEARFAEFDRALIQGVRRIP